MNGLSFFNLVALPLFFGLFGFIEPCSFGSTLVMVKRVEARTAAQKVAHMVAFATSRALLIGSLGVAAALAGTMFFGFQTGAWFVLGVGYVALGLAYFSGHAARLMRSFGPRLNRLQGKGGAVMLGLIFGRSIPASPLT